ncbi:MAG: VCBS repeat-containing protein [Nitrospirae bacterium]|nr:VCBS repeat-containing protein [Nitrospirota bacterium]
MRKTFSTLICFLLLAASAYAEEDPLATLANLTASYFNPVSGSVDRTEGKTVYFSVGEKDLLKPGMRLRVSREGAPFIHPVTKEVMGKIETPAGKIEVREVKAGGSSGVMIEGEAKPGDRVRLSDTKVRMLFCQDKGVDWYLADDLHRKLKATGRIDMIDTSLETSDEKKVLEEASRRGADIALILTAREEDKNAFFRERVYWVSDGSKFIDTETRIAAEFSKDLKFGETLFTPRAGEAVMSYNLPFRGRHLATGDFAGDGRQELLISNGSDIRIYMPSTDLQLLWEIKGSGSDDHVWIDTLDLNKNGKDEIIVTSMKGGDVVSYIYEFDGSGFKKLWETRHFLRKSGNGLIAQSYSESEGFGSGIVNVVWKGEYALGETIKTPRGVNIYDFVSFSGPQKEALLFAYDDKGFLNLYDEKGTRVWKSNAATGGFITTFKKSSPASYVEAGEWSVKDRLVQRHREIMVVTRTPLADMVRTVGYKSSSIKNYWWNGFSMDEGVMIDGIKGSLLDYAVTGDRVIVLSSPFMGLKFENLLKGESPLGSMLYIYSVKGR